MINYYVDDLKWDRGAIGKLLKIWKANELLKKQEELIEDTEELTENDYIDGTEEDPYEVDIYKRTSGDKKKFVYTWIERTIDGVQEMQVITEGGKVMYIKNFMHDIFFEKAGIISFFNC